MPTSARILVVDDDEGIRLSLGRLLRAKGYEVAVAADGKSAIETARTLQPDFTILDIRMPNMDGIETLKAMRAERPATQAMFMTAYSASNPETTSSTSREDVRVLGKPLDLEVLWELLRTSLPTH